MSNVANKHHQQNPNKYPNNISRVSHPNQSINPRGSVPTDNHSRPDHQRQPTYSHAASRGLSQPAHPSHDSVIGKSHPNASAVQQVVLPNLSAQVPNVNPTGPQMPTSAVANAGPNHLQVLQQQSAPQMLPQNNRFMSPFHQQHPQHQQRPQRHTLIQNHNRNSNAVPNSAVNPTVQQNIAHTGPQYFILNPQQQFQQIQTQFIPQHMSHSYQRPPLQIQQPYYMYAQQHNPQQQQQQSFQPQTTYPQYTVYPPPHYPQPPPHQSAPMVQQMQPRSQPVSAPPVIQASAPPLTVQMPGPNTEMNESTAPPMPAKPQMHTKRTRTLAVLTDPNSGENINLEELAKNPKEEFKSQTPVNRKTESHPGASNSPNAGVVTSSSEADNSIALQFATKVARMATQPIAGHSSTTGVNETISVNSKPEKEEPVAISPISKATISEPMDKLSESEPLTEKSQVIETNSANSASDMFDKTDSKLSNDISAQNSIENNSQMSGENVVHELSENEDNNRDMNTKEENEDKVETKPEIAKDCFQQKVNINNNIDYDDKKDATIKGDNNDKHDDKVDNACDVTDNVVPVIDKIEPQPICERSSPVMIPTLDKECTDNLTKTNVLYTEPNCENDIQNEMSRSIDVTPEDECPVQTEEPESAIPSPKASLPDLPYKDDQWTPLNPDGKKHYERDFLYAVRDKSVDSLKMPEVLNNDRNHEIIRKISKESSGHTNDEPSNFFMPNYVKPNDMRHRGMAPPASRRSSQPGRQDNKHRKIISTSLTQDVKLHTTENAWKPLMKPNLHVSDPEELETLELLKRIRGILNKLTPQKYDALSNQILSFKIDTEDRLKRVLDLVFEKAVDEPAFCLQYANLCKHLSKFKVLVNKEENAEEVKFLKLLLSKCQKEFETDIYASITDLKERREEIDNCSDPPKKKMLFEVLDEDMRRARKRSLGNIKLIGELYKLNMLKANIMVQCIDNLIKEADDESLECLCALLRTIGEQIETEASDKAKQTQLLDSFFVKMQLIADQKDSDVKGTSARVRFMLRDVNDMRRNHWKARRDENLPKMIDEIHKEAQKEDEQMVKDLQQHSMNKKQEERDRKQKGLRPANDSTDGNQWTVIARKSQNATQPNIDWQKMRTMQQQNHDNVQLGPQSGSAWSMGSRGGGGTSQSRFAAEDKQLNRFSPLESNDNRKSSQKIISSRDSSKGRSNQNYGQQGRGGRSQGGGRSGEREDAMNLVRNFSARQSPSESSPAYPNMISRNSSRSDSREASAPNSRNSSIRRDTPDIEVNQLRGSQSISNEDLEEKCKVSITEYLNVKSMDEPVIDLCNLCNDSNVEIYVLSAINCSLENSSQSDHFLIGKLINHLICKQCIKLDHFHKGLNLILENSGDVELDVPKMWDYIGEILAPIFVNLASNRKTFLLDIAKHCERGKSSKFIAKIIKAVAMFTTEMKANELWHSCGLSWTDFLDPNQNIEDFVEQNSVEFTTKTPNKSINNFEHNYQPFIEEMELLVKQKKSNDEMQSFISKHFNASQTSDDRFTSALFRAIIQGCIIAPQDVRETTLDEPQLVSCAPVLQKFLGGDAEHELQALIVLQELMEKLEHPPNLLLKIFQCLYDNNVISHDGFLQWERCESSGSGKAVAVKSVVRFLTWLRENEDDDEDAELTTS